MSDVERVRRILRDALQLGSRADSLTPDSRLLGGIPEFDSMAVINVVAMLEEEYGISFNDDDLSAEVFETVGSLSSFVAAAAAR